MFSRKTTVGFLIIMIALYVAASAQAPDTLWTRTYGIADRVSECWDVVGMPDGGLAMVGTIAEPGYLSRLYVVRINSEGDTLWTGKYADRETQ